MVTPSGMPPEMEELLRFNGIDPWRCTEVEITHDVEYGITKISVTLVALKPKAEF
jgi:hypothetical protein